MMIGDHEECLVGMVIQSKLLYERTTSVNVDWDLVQECKRRGYKIKGLKTKKKKTRESIKEGVSPGGGVVSKGARGADAASSERPHGGVPHGRT